MVLTPYDKESGVWQRLKAHYEERLNNLRQQNDAQMSEDKRNVLIGQISEVRYLLAMDQVEVSIPNVSQEHI